MPHDAPEDPKESLVNILCFSPRDWAANKEDAWIYGIIVGWAESVGIEGHADAVWEQLKKQHRWTDQDVARLQRLHRRFNALKSTSIRQVN